MKVKELVAELLRQNQETTVFVRASSDLQPVLGARTAKESESPIHPQMPWRRLALGSFVLIY